ncbi:FAD dependent oxidoreductase [Xylariaceae sp. FL0016]|nr:FAD dependent oxidoreductase [Xylariaceae sp. FL0016]
MGAVQSHFNTFCVAFKTLLSLNKELRELLERASGPPGLPVPNPSAPYWLEDPPYPELVNHQSPQLPAEADIVIIGSGITAAAVARTALHETARRRHAAADKESGVSPGPSKPTVAVLEARSLCSGATGRNGGHIKSSPHELLASLRQTMSPERAVALTRFQLRHLGVLTGLCEVKGWDIAECREVETVDLYLDEEDREKAFDEVRELAKWVPELNIEIWGESEARKKFEANHHIKGAISYTAGALWPFRFVSCVWKDLLTVFGDQLLLETSTGVTDIAVTKESIYAYELTTTRGSIKCNHVVHATNGFATQFVPGLRGKMTGCLGHMTAQRPGRSFVDHDGSRSWSVIYGSCFDYVTQRPSSAGQPGDIMLGGGFDRSKGQGANSIGVWDDSQRRTDTLTMAHVGGIFPTIFSPQWGEDAEGGRVKAAWSGIISVTGDMLPFVGRLSPKLTGRKIKTVSRKSGMEAHMGREGQQLAHSGEWVSAGYCGDGMVWAWLSGTAVGLMLAGTEAEDVPARPGLPGGRLTDWFPKELEPSLGRVKKAGLENFADHFF